MTNVFKGFRDEVFKVAKSYRKPDNLEIKYKGIKVAIIEVAKQTNYNSRLTRQLCVFLNLKRALV